MPRDAYRMAWPIMLLMGALGVLVIVWLLYAPWWLTIGGILALVVAGAVEAFLATRWGVLCERADTMRTTVGGWSLTRGDVTVDGWLLPHHRADAERFAYRIHVVLDEDDATARVDREIELNTPPPPSGGPS